MIRWGLAAAWVAWFACALAEVLIVFYDVESVIVTGPIILVLGLIGILIARFAGYLALALVCCGNALVCLLFFGLVVLLDWSPSEAETPFVVMGLLYVVGTLPIVCSLARWAPRALNPWECVNCCYLLYGLAEPRCPECGEPFDPSLLNAECPGSAVE